MSAETGGDRVPGAAELGKAIRAARRADPRRAFHVVDAFEDELCAFTGAPYAVAVDSCTNALHLALLYERLMASRVGLAECVLPARTYIGVLHAARNAGYAVSFRDIAWQQAGNWYAIPPTRVIDSARVFERNLYNYRRFTGSLVCLSFHAAKQLALGRGGAILTDDADANVWLRRARADGRTEGAGQEARPQFPGFHCYMPPPTAALGLWILSRMDGDPAPMREHGDPDLSAL